MTRWKIQISLNILGSIFSVYWITLNNSQAWKTSGKASVWPSVLISFKMLTIFCLFYPSIDIHLASLGSQKKKKKKSLTYPWSKMSAGWPEGWNNYLWWPCRSQCQSREPQGSRIKAWKLAWAQTTAWGSLLLFDTAALCWKSCFFRLGSNCVRLISHFPLSSIPFLWYLQN